MQLTLDLADDNKGQEQAVIQDMAVDRQNRIVLFASNQNILVLNPDGSKLFESRADGRIYDICSINGRVFIGYDDSGEMAIKEIDVSGKRLSEKLVHNIPGNQFYMTAGRNGNLLIASEESVYQYNLETKEISKKFDWQTYDFTVSRDIIAVWRKRCVSNQ